MCEFGFICEYVLLSWASFCRDDSVFYVNNQTCTTITSTFSGVYRVQHRNNSVHNINSRSLNWLIPFGGPTIRGKKQTFSLLYLNVTNFERHVLFMSYSNE